MAYKTMLRQLISKWGIMSTELQMAMENDMAAIRDDGTPEYVDNADLEPQPVAEAQATEITPNDEADSRDFGLEDDFFAGLEPPPQAEPAPNSRRHDAASNSRIGCVQNTISYLAAPGLRNNVFTHLFP